MDGWQAFYADWHYVIGNGVVVVLISVVGYLVWRASRRDYWREAARRSLATRRAAAG